MSHEYDYPDDTPTREDMEQLEAARDPPECICENAANKLYNPDCYWHGTEGVETLEKDGRKALMNELGITDQDIAETLPPKHPEER